MTFEEYLSGKKIDSEKFHLREKELWESWSAEFKQMHPNSFTMQKLYLINPIRRKYPLTETAAIADKQSPKPAAKTVKPLIKPKPKF